MKVLYLFLYLPLTHFDHEVQKKERFVFDHKEHQGGIFFSFFENTVLLYDVCTTASILFLNRIFNVEGS